MFTNGTYLARDRKNCDPNTTFKNKGFSQGKIADFTKHATV